ncbi:hypothetical protein N0Y54_29415 [Nostoc punctiforme UO1]|uniref:hypothetical protein n=1 Tax=Nostoc punctiforme TaxID=272131 RepID=UPI00309A8C02
MASIQITEITNETSLVEQLSDKELDTVFGGQVTVLSCNRDGSYTYTDGKNTWNAKPWWKWW